MIFIAYGQGERKCVFEGARSACGGYRDAIRRHMVISQFGKIRHVDIRAGRRMEGLIRLWECKSMYQAIRFSAFYAQYSRLGFNNLHHQRNHKILRYEMRSSR